MPTPRTIIATLLACALVALSSSRSTHLQVLAQEAAVPAGATPSATPAVDPRVEKYKRDAAADVDGMKTFTQQMVIRSSAMVSWRSRKWRRPDT